MLTQAQSKDRVIGSSDAPAIMKVSPWTTPFQLWEQKVKNIQVEENSAMRRGSLLEPEARRLFEKMKKCEVFPYFVKHPEHFWMTSNLDGICLDMRIMTEIKCTSEENHELAKQGKVPEYYSPQLQHQLECVRIIAPLIETVCYFSYFKNQKTGTEDGVIVEVERDKQYVSTLVAEEEKFYNDNILKLIPPDLLDKDYENKDEDWDSIARERWQVMLKLKELKKVDDELMARLVSCSNNKNSKSSGFKFTKYAIKGRVDYDLIPQLKEIDLERYRKESSFGWRLSQL